MSRQGRNLAMTLIGLGFLALAWGRSRLLGYTTPNRVHDGDVEGRIAYVLDVFSSLRRSLPEDFDLTGKDVLEMSPGSSRGIGALAIAVGARSYHAVDAFDLAGLEDPGFYKLLLGRFEGCSDADRTRALAAIKDPDVFGYVVGREFYVDQLAGARRFDLVLSCAAFEHYTKPGEAIASLTRVARPGCQTIHIIDMQTHTRWIRDRDPNNIYRFPEPVYRFFSFPGQPNRVRPRSFVHAFEAHGWQDVRFLPLRTVAPSLLEASLHGLVAPFDEAVMEMDVLNGVLTARFWSEP